MSNKTSIIWKLSDDKFIELIRTSQTMSQVLRYFGMENKGGNYVTCKTRIGELNLDTSHFLSRVESSNLAHKVTKEEFLETLTENSTVTRSSVKERLIKFNLLEYKCNCCGNDGIWNNKKLSLQLEHKNGISNDNRLENLAFLCPNCHSQTDTYAGKSLKKYYFCKICSNPCKGYSKENKCGKCARKQYDRPTKEYLENAIKIKPLRIIGKELNVSGATISDWCIDYNIDYKNISPFSKINKIAKPKKIGRKFPSKYNHVSYDSKRDKWIVHLNPIDNKEGIFKRFNTELEAAQAVANYFNSKELIIRKTNF